MDVFVIGDVAHQLILTPDRSGITKKHERWVGAPLLETMIEVAIGKSENARELKKMDPYFDKRLDEKKKSCEAFTAIVRPYPKHSKSKKDDDPAYRLQMDVRDEPSVRPYNEKDVTALFASISSAFGQPKEGPAIVVAYDRGKGFRNNVDVFQPLLSQVTYSSPLVYVVEHDLNENEPEKGSKSDLDDGLRKALTTISRAGVNKPIVVVTANALRRAGHHIVEFGSIEQAVEDVVCECAKPPLSDLCAYASELIVIFRETAALRLHLPVEPEKTDTPAVRSEPNNPAEVDRLEERVADNTQPDMMALPRPIVFRGSIHYCPNWDRIAQIDQDRYGIVPSKVPIFITALVRGLWLRGSDEGGGGKDVEATLDEGLRMGALTFNVYAQEGLDPDSPFSRIEMAFGQQSIKRLMGDADKEKYFVSSLVFPSVSQAKCADRRSACEIGAPKATPPSWTRVDSFLKTKELQDSNESLKPLLREIVTAGIEGVFRTEAKVIGSWDSWHPASTITCPYAQFGKYRTIDDREIANYFDLAKLIYKYLQTNSWPTPLSIAVFGPPGAGKNFAVKEILEYAAPTAGKREPLTFNLSQFNSVEQLTNAFHQVQDRALADDDVPLVIFDEFDTLFNNDAGGVRLGWLKYFLAPMQDGTFNAGSQVYRVGRAIFLFSGGVYQSFDDFNEPVTKLGQRQDGLDFTARKEAKLPDFVSRLRGHLTVENISIERLLSPRDPRLKVVLLRRAMLLRSMLEQHARPIFRLGSNNKLGLADIQDAVIDTFIWEWEYHHGVRSLEAMVQSSHWISDVYAKSSLPSAAQSAPHVRKLALTPENGLEASAHAAKAGVARLEELHAELGSVKKLLEVAEAELQTLKAALSPRNDI